MASSAAGRDLAAPAGGYAQGAAPAGHRHAEGQPTLSGQYERAEPPASVQRVVTSKQQEREQRPRGAWAGGEAGPAVLSREPGSFTGEEQHCFGALPAAGTRDTKTRVPRYLPAPGGIPGPLSHGEGLPVLTISAGSPCISDTPFLRLLLLTGWVGWKEGDESLSEARYFPFPVGRVIQGRRPARCPGRALRLLRASLGLVPARHRLGGTGAGRGQADPPGPQPAALPGDGRPSPAELRTSHPAARNEI